jgi:SAM-dependent methyltransferase
LGSVTGIDVTASQLAVARAHVDEWSAEIGWSNLRFVEGPIEALSEAGLTDASFDLVISNCVVNLSPDKRAVLREAWRVLADGGEMHFSDVYCDRRLPSELRSDSLLVGECLGGALYVEDFKRLCAEIGFADPRVLTSAPITVEDEALACLLGEARFRSITYRLFKLPAGRLETLCEDYGQFAVYKGTIPHAPNAYSLDDHHRLEKSKPFLVCGNTASMLGETWLSKHFEVHGGRSTHYGLFPCGPAPADAGVASTGSPCC